MHGGAPDGDVVIAFAHAGSDDDADAASRLLPDAAGFHVKTKGARLMAAFSDPAAMADWAIAAQRATGQQLRIGAWIGSPVLRHSARTGLADYFGPVVNRAARVAAAVHPGQCVVDRALAERLTQISVHARSLGLRVLRGVPRPVELIELSDANRPPPTFPDLAVPSPPRSNLAEVEEPLVGRHDGFDALDQALRVARVVTVTGPPGVGKSRLAHELGRSTLSLGGEVWRVPLAGRHGPEALAAAVSDALGLAIPAVGPGRAVQAGLAQRGPVLLLLDDADGALEAIERCCGAWLQGVPALTLLVTARAPTGLAGEAVVPLGGLPCAAAAGLFLAGLDALRGAPHCPDDADAACEIAGQLDGNPLALKLAVARCAVLSPRRLLGLLDRRLDLLKSERLLAGGDRHPSLRSAVEEVWGGLDARDRTLVRRATVFRAPFPISAAPVLGAEPAELERLADRSLFERDWSGDEGADVRVRPWEAVRARAREEGPLPPELRRAHSDWLVDELHGCWDLDLLALYRRDLDAAIAHAGGESMGRLVVIRERLRSSRGPHLGRVEAITQALQHPVPVELRVDLLRALMAASFDLGDSARGLQAQAQVAQTLAEVADPSPQLVAQVQLANSGPDMLQGRLRQAAASLRECLPHLRDPWDEARAWTRLAVVLIELDEPHEARVAGQTAVTQHRALGDARSEARVLGNVALLDLDSGAPEEALSALARAAQTFASTGEDRLRLVANGNGGLAQLMAGRAGDARDALLESIAGLERLGDHRFQGYLYAYLAAAQLALRDPEAARDAMARSRQALPDERDAALAAARAVYAAAIEGGPPPPLVPGSPLDVRLAHRAVRAARAPDSQRGELLLRRARARFRRGQPDAAREDLAEPCLDASPRLRARREQELGNLAVETGNLSEAAQRLGAAAPLLEAVGAAGEAASARANEAIAHAHQGRFPQAEACLRQALSSARRRGDEPLEARVLTNLGTLAMIAGDGAAVEEHLRRAIRLNIGLGERRAEALGRLSLGTWMRQSGDLESALPELRRAEHLLSGLGDRRGAAGASAHLGCMAMDAGDLEQGHARLRAVDALYESIGELRLRAAFLPFLGAARAQRGDLRGAEEAFALAEQLARSIDAPEPERAAALLRGLLNPDQGPALLASVPVTASIDVTLASVSLRAGLVRAGALPSPG